ncbi:MAG: 4-hydroxy-tetrahydrodipicolinate reductase [Planctomycetes bacterium]|nr:4-hydroxy-tetrahydrodipicolinate reductase [Planctomycetota bacterium]
MITVCIGGHRGRMGQRLEALLADDARFEIVARYDLDTASTDDTFDVLIDFSAPEGTMKCLSLCQQKSAGLLIGCTGHSEEQKAQITKAAGDLPILMASNFSLGINLLLNMLPRIARELGDDFDIEIVETHHTRKIDAPSGTALTLLDALMAATDRSRSEHVIHGREGRIGAKPDRQIGLHAVRSGDVVGRHEIIFGGVGESITITHEAHSRDTFAKGALEAAAWIHNKPPGLYTMKDVLSERG